MQKLLFITAFLIAGMISCKKASKLESFSTPYVSHTCPFPHCPYKGETSLTILNAEEGAKNGNQLWCIDSLHFIYPSWSYDQLETKSDQIFNELKFEP